MPQHVDVTVTGDWRDYMPRPTLGGWVDPRLHILPLVPDDGSQQPLINPHGNLPGGLIVNPDAQPPTIGNGIPGAGTGSDPLSTLAAAYMASLGGSGGIGATAPIVIPAAAGGESTAINWTMIGALAAIALVLWAVYTWWKKHHGGTA